MAIFKRLRPPNVMIYFAVFASLLWFMVVSTLAQPGYLSIDCGLSSSGFTDTNGIKWVPDNGYISTGQIAIVPGYLTGDTRGTLRYFPENIPKNCYDLSPVTEGNPYMVRAMFHYGNYDKNNSPPTFALIIDGTVMQNPVRTYTDKDTYYEMYIVAKSSSINVCLGRSTAENAGNLFISSLELRPLPSGSSYNVVLQQGYGLVGIKQWDLGANSSEKLRYPNDKYDRIWHGVPSSNGNNLETTEAVVVGGGLAPSYPPALLFQTAIQVATVSFSRLLVSRNYHVVMFFAEISARVTQAGDRVFDISSNSYSNLLATSVDIFNLTGGQYKATEIPSHFPLTPSSTTNSLVINFTASSLSTYPPLIAGIQLMLYTQDPMSNLTDSNDALAINSIRDYYKIGGSSGDPCLPTNYNWTWITCDTNKSPPRIISILLSKAGLEGNISADFNLLTALTEIQLDNNELTGSIPDLSSLSVLQKLDLQNNNLSGTIPASLAQLPSLTELFLQNNKLQGQVPSDLLQKANDNKLNLNFEGNNIVCNGSCSSSTPPSTAPKPKNHIGLIIGIVVGLILLVTIVIIMICCIRKCCGGGSNKPQPMGAITTPTPPENKKHPHGVSRTEIFEAATTTQEFTFTQIMVATQNFTKLLGEGGFGPVYEGTLENGVIVAIKVLSQASIQGAREFLNEVGLLSRVHHRNLVRLVGYCTEQKLVLVYEFMSKGSLFDLLFRRAATNTPLTWRERLAIMIDAAHGLEYLHHGCNSLIIHRDVKSSNILLTNKLEAKMSDFGISRLTSNDNDNIATSLVGSMGYLDPEYASTFRLTEKIDIYSFGVVLFETICGQRPVIRKNIPSQEIHIVEWVRPSYEGGSIEEVVDRSFGNAYNVYSVWKVAEVAMACVQFEGAKRPSMSEVCAELKEAMKLEADTNLNPTRDVSVASTGVFSLTHVRAR